jgi:hypothetical protein
MLYLPIGGAWLVASRLGIQPLGFGDTIVLLTAVHFHFAGFAAPVLAGLAGRTVAAGTRSVERGVAGGGIVLEYRRSPRASAVLANVGPCGADSNYRWVCWRCWLPGSSGQNSLRTAQVLLWIASISSLVEMVLACSGLLHCHHTLIIDIRAAMTHGLLTCYFAACLREVNESVIIDMLVAGRTA